MKCDFYTNHKQLTNYYNYICVNVIVYLFQVRLYRGHFSFQFSAIFLFSCHERNWIVDETTICKKTYKRSNGPLDRFSALKHMWECLLVLWEQKKTGKEISGVLGTFVRHDTIAVSPIAKKCSSRPSARGGVCKRWLQR